MTLHSTSARSELGQKPSFPSRQWLRAPLERHGKAAAPTTIAFIRVRVIHSTLTVFTLETLVSTGPCTTQEPLSLTSIFVALGALLQEAGPRH
jgi:hypothetical protein